MTLAEQVFHQLRRDIVSGKLKPMQPLRLDHLKKLYGVGFSPLREALNRLQSERLVQSVALRGFTVAPASQREMWDAIETRILIETRALRLSIALGDDDWESRLVGSLHALTLQHKRMADNNAAASADEDEALEARHQEFHATLISACGSERLIDFAQKLYIQTERYRYSGLHQRLPVGDRDVRAEHGALLSAAIDRDADRAAALLKRHYRLTGEMLDRTFDPSLGEKKAMSS
ncbi:MAG: FCD domain-containing protein [Pararhodobacter sp.]|nr:FCD domain-containing protein [Pararhodobacter sp.]